MATLNLVSQALGEKNKKEAFLWLRHAVWLAVLIPGSIGLVLAVTPSLWLSWFLIDPQVVQMAVGPMIILGLYQALDAAGIVLSYAQLGGGENRTVMLIHFANQWLVFVPVCYIWVVYFRGDLMSLWWCMSGYRILLLLSFWLNHRRGRWLEIVV